MSLIFMSLMYIDPHDIIVMKTLILIRSWIIFVLITKWLFRENLTCLLWNGVLIPLYLLFLLMTFFSMKCLFCLVFIKLSVSLHIFLLAILWICFSLMILTELVGAQCSLLHLDAFTSRIYFPKLSSCKWFYKLLGY